MGEGLLADRNLDAADNELPLDGMRYTARLRAQLEVHPAGTVSWDRDPLVAGDPEDRPYLPGFWVAGHEVHLPVDSLDSGVEDPEGRRRVQFDPPLVDGGTAVVVHTDDQPVGGGVVLVDPVPDVDKGAGGGDDEVRGEGVIDGALNGDGLSSPRRLSGMCGGLQ